MIKWKYTITQHPHRPYIVFLHGFMGKKSDWQAHCDTLSPQYNTLSIDLPGHGHTPFNHSSDLALNQILENLDQLLDTLDIKTVHLVGYSLGGRIAQHWALKHPKKILSLTLLSSSPGIINETEKQNRLKADIALAQSLKTNFQDFLESWAQNPIWQLEDSQRNDFIKKRLHNDPKALSKLLIDLSPGNIPHTWNLYKNPPFPIHIIVGETDKKYCHIANEIQKKAPETTLTIVKNCGHFTIEKSIPSLTKYFENM